MQCFPLYMQKDSEVISERRMKHVQFSYDMVAGVPWLLKDFIKLALIECHSPTLGKKYFS